jgi:hypothetical protein
LHADPVNVQLSVLIHSVPGYHALVLSDVLFRAADGVAQIAPVQAHSGGAGRHPASPAPRGISQLDLPAPP